MYMLKLKCVCSYKCASLLALGTTNPSLLCLHMKVCLHTQYIAIHIWQVPGSPTSLWLPLCALVQVVSCSDSTLFSPSLSLFLPSFLSNCLISLSFLFSPLIFSSFLSNFAIPLCFSSFSSSFSNFLFLGYNFAPTTRFQHLLSWFIIHFLCLMLCVVQSETRSLIYT